MIELTTSARQRLEDYLGELRRVLGECPALDAAEVERDVQDHIQSALATEASPVDDERLDAVLQSLGAPSDWVQDQRVPWFRRPPREWWQEARQTASAVTHRLAAGPESYRLPYLSLLVLALGLCAGVIFRDGVVVMVILTLAAFVLARAALAVQPEGGPTPSQMWLLSPALLVVYVPLVVAVIGWPLLAGSIMIDETSAIRSNRIASLRATERSAEAVILQIERNLMDYRRHADMEDRRRAEATGGNPAAAPFNRSSEVQLINELDGVRGRLAEIRTQLEATGLPPVWGGITWTTDRMYGATALGTGVWWMMIGVLIWLNVGVVKSIIRPYCAVSRGRGGLLLAGLGAVLTAGGTLLLA